MKRLFCLLLFFILIFSIILVCSSCTTAQKKTCECPHQLKTFTSYIDYSAESANKWLQENPQFEIVNIQYAFGTNWTGSGDATYGLIITYIPHTCK